MNVLPKDLFRMESTTLHFGYVESRPLSHKTLDKSAIAAMTAAAIERMTNDELMRIIRVSQLPALLRPDFLKHLPYFDRETLLRMTFLARRRCRNQCIATPLTQLVDGELESIPH